MPLVPTGVVSGDVQRGCCGGDCQAEDPGSELVPGSEFDPAVLGLGAALPSHGAGQHELRAARGIAYGVGGRAGRSLGTTCHSSHALKKGLEALGAEVSLDAGYIVAKAKRLKGTTFEFPISSVGASGNICFEDNAAK